jgi:hypothetical protein
MGCCTSKVKRPSKDKPVSAFDTPNGDGIVKDDNPQINKRRHFNENITVKDGNNNQDTPDDGINDDNMSSPDHKHSQEKILQENEDLSAALRRAIHTGDKALLLEVLT